MCNAVWKKASLNFNKSFLSDILPHLGGSSVWFGFSIVSLFTVAVLSCRRNTSCKEKLKPWPVDWGEGAVGGRISPWERSSRWKSRVSLPPVLYSGVGHGLFVFWWGGAEEGGFKVLPRLNSSKMDFYLPYVSCSYWVLWILYAFIVSFAFTD